MMNTLLSFGLALFSVTLAIPVLADDKAQASPAQRIGDALVELRVLRVEEPFLQRGKAANSARTKGLLVKVTITNKSGSKTIKYNTWNLPVESTGNVAKVVDDTGKKLALFGEWPYHGGNTRTIDIKPGKSFSEYLVFKAPSPNAKRFTFHLPGECVGSTGEWKFIVPRRISRTQVKQPPKPKSVVAMLIAKRIVGAKLTGKVNTGLHPRIMTRGSMLGSFTHKGWVDRSRITSRLKKMKASMYFSTGYSTLKGKKTVHTPGVLTLKFADGTTAQVALPDLTIDDKGDAVNGAGKPVPKTQGQFKVFLGSNGNSYYDEAGTRLAASLKKSDTQDPSPPKPPAKTPLPLRTWTSATGTYTIQARFVSLKGGVLTLERESGKTITVPVEKLSKTDRAYAKAKAASK